MEHEERTVRFDKELEIEAYCFKGIMQKFPNHFHEYYVIGFIESGERHLSCKNKEYNIGTGDLLLFNPMDNHTCEQIDNKTLDYRCINIKPEIMKKAVFEVTGKEYLPKFTVPVAFRSEQISLLRELHQVIMEEQLMDTQNTKCVMVIDEALPMGIITNTAAIMGITLGKHIPEAVGSDVLDKTGNNHLGIIEFPVPILKGNTELIKELRKKLYRPEYSELTVVDFSDVAQSCHTYDVFIKKIANVFENELQYFGIAICGNKKQVNKLTGSMPLLR